MELTILYIGAALLALIVLAMATTVIKFSKTLSTLEEQQSEPIPSRFNDELDEEDWNYACNSEPKAAQKP